MESQSCLHGGKMNKEYIKKMLHQSIEEVSDPRFALHLMYKEKMKEIIASAIFCFVNKEIKESVEELQEVELMEKAMYFSEKFVELNFKMDE